MSIQLVTSKPSGLFPLGSAYPSWSGNRIDQMRVPLEAGVRRLRVDLAAAAGAVVCTANLFDYDGRIQWIDSIVAVGDNFDVIAERLLKEGVARARRELSGLVESTVMPTPRPINVLPATGAILPGRFPIEVLGCRLENRSVFEQAEIRVLLVRASADTSASDALFQCDGLSTPLIDYLASFGGWSMARLPAC